MSATVEGRVVVVTGAGRGIGRAEALEFANQGAKVVVNDLSDSAGDPAGAVVAEIRRSGGEAVASHDDVSDWDGARRLIDTALDCFGGLDVLVNNAGILRDRMFVNMSPLEWDDVIRVHLRGTFAPTRLAAQYWRERAKTGDPRDACVINTTSASGLYGAVGQANYGAAKGGIASLTVILAQELARYRVRVNAIAPVALTRMTEGLRERDDAEKAEMAPEHVASLVVWLGGAEASSITGQVISIKGGWIGIAEGWTAGPQAHGVDTSSSADLGRAIIDLVGKTTGPRDMNGQPVGR